MAPFKYRLSIAGRRIRPAHATGWLLAAAFGAAALCTAPVRAAGAEAPGDDPPAVRVRYDDLNLDTDGGAATLLMRIKQAARQVCPIGDSRDMGAFMASRRCEREAIARAVAQVGSPRLAALYPVSERRGSRTGHG